MNDDCLRIPIESLDRLLNDANPTEAYQKLATLIREYKEKTTPLPWDNQEEYGKLYRASQLLKN